MSTTGKVSAVVAIVVAIAVAYLVTNRNRNQTDQSAQVAATDSVPAAPPSVPDGLDVGSRFPSVNLISEPDSAEVTRHIGARDVIGGHSALVVFVAQNCPPCDAFVKSWSESMAGLPSDVLVFGVINASPETRNGYRVLTDAQFPIYSDSTHAFGSNYGVAVYPTVVGVDADGKVVFAQNAPDPGFTPDAAVALLRSSSSP